MITEDSTMNTDHNNNQQQMVVNGVAAGHEVKNDD
jgi:hypothetical protein